MASAIPLRKEGVVRTQGKYYNRVEDVMYNREKPSLLEGPWRPTAAQVSVSEELKAMIKEDKIKSNIDIVDDTNDTSAAGT